MVLNIDYGNDVPHLMVMILTIMIIMVMMVLITMQRPRRPPPENRLLYTQSVQLDTTQQYAYPGRNV